MALNLDKSRGIGYVTGEKNLTNCQIYETSSSKFAVNEQTCDVCTEL